MADGWDDDDTLFAALRDAVRARRAVPAEFVQAGKNAYAWHDIDAELAQLTYDSTSTSGQAAATRSDLMTTRSDQAYMRALTFRSTRLTIELEVTADSLLGQVIPIQAAQVEVQTSAGSQPAIRTDDIGCFSIRPLPDGPFRLHCRGPGIDVLTGWITL